MQRLISELKADGVKLWVDRGRLVFRAPPGALSDARRHQVEALRPALIELLSAQNPFFSDAELFPRFADFPVCSQVKLRAGQAEYWREIARGEHATRFVNATHGVLREARPLDAAALKAALYRLVDRHKILSARVIDNGESGVTIFNGDAWVDLEVHAPSLNSEAGNHEEAKTQVAELIWAPFEIERHAPLRAQVVDMGDEGHIIVIVINHFFVDSQAFQIVFKEFKIIYDGIRSNSPINLPPAGLDYCSYLSGISIWLESPAGAICRTYWAKHLAKNPPTRFPVLPIDRLEVRPVIGVPFYIGSSVTLSLRKLASVCKVMVFDVIFSAIMIAQALITRQSDLTMYSISHCRGEYSTCRIVGNLANLVPHRVLIDTSRSFRDLVQETHRIVINNNKYNFFHHRELLSLYPEVGASKVIPILNYFNFKYKIRPDIVKLDGVAGGLSAEQESATASRMTSHYINIVEWKEDIIMNFKYLQGQYDEVTVLEFLEKLRGVLEAAIIDPDVECRGI